MVGPDNTQTPKYNKLYKDKRNGKVCGVCAGLGDYFAIDTTVIRVVAVIGLFTPANGIICIGYFLLCWLLDNKPSDLFETKEEDKFWKGVRTQPKNTVRDVRHKFREIERRLRATEAHVTSKQYNLHREFKDLEDN